jgi:hypothetical protein
MASRDDIRLKLGRNKKLVHTEDVGVVAPTLVGSNGGPPSNARFVVVVWADQDFAVAS